MPEKMHTMRLGKEKHGAYENVRVNTLALKAINAKIGARPQAVNDVAAGNTTGGNHGTPRNNGRVPKIRDDGGYRGHRTR